MRDAQGQEMLETVLADSGSYYIFSSMEWERRRFPGS